MFQRLLSFSKRYCLFCLLLLFPVATSAQYIFHPENLPEKVSLHPYASLANTGSNVLTIQEVIAQKEELGFRPLHIENADLGFTVDNWWVKVSIENKINRPLEYYLETARPITDLVELYIVTHDGKIRRSVSGDRMKCEDRSYSHRKTIFRLELPPQSVQTIYIHMLSDGEVIQLPLMLRTSESLMEITSLEQFIFGIFYGILLIAAIIYIFFFFGIRERTFIYYGLYVLFIGLLQLALDGYFYQYITPGGGWFSQRAVLIFATIAAFFLGRYGQVFLRIKNYNRVINRLFDVTYGLLVILLLFLIFSPDIEYGYPAANILGLLVLVLIIGSVISMFFQKVPIDVFFATGIFFLVTGFVIFILNNFGQIPTSFFSQNSSKFGTGMEVIFLSLSMANLIARLKNEREEFNRLALARSEEMNEMKTYFLSNISHELRTPLNAIMTLSSEMSKGAADEKVRQDALIIKYSSHSLLSSVNDILDFSKIEKGELKLESVTFDPVRLLEHLKFNAENRAKDQGLEFTYSKSGEFPEMLNGDVTRLAQIVNNVLSNAVKFTSAGFIKFHLEAQPRQANKCRLIISITDSGVGIPKEKMRNIFESFTQDNINNKRKFGGLGLGLYIVKTLVDMQNGKISIDSKIGQGTACKIILDYEIAQEQKPPVLSENPVFDLQGTNILVVEDNAINQMVIKMITKKWLNTTVSYTMNGQEALDAVRAQHFDIILMDLQMPVMDGYEATIAIRKGEAGEHNKDIPIVAVTADVMETTKERVKEIGMNDYLSKPLKNETLYESVKALVG
ncbi:MAG TPA: 7TM diverse intracellular signaling domain-containing protein [Flavobacterium sp.]|jgi:signal transduction histidine kinase/CheY-like chemotaxis protein